MARSRWVFAVLAVGALVVWSAPPAQADIRPAVCANLDITFDLTDGTFGGSGSCTVPQFGTATTNLGGDGAVSVWDCGTLVGNGTFGQTWSAFLPFVGGGTYVVTGTWLGATMTVTGWPGHTPARFNAVITLIPNPANATKLLDCDSATSLRFTGIQVLVDPPEE